MTPNQHYRIGPTTDEFDPAIVERTFAGWHSTGSRLPFLGSPPPTLEVLLTTTDSTLEYYVGTDDDLEHTLRQLLPATYELTETTTPLDDFDHTADLTALEFHAKAQRRGDHLTHLSPFTDFHNDSTRWPLARVADALATTDVPTVVQILARPTIDRTATADVRIQNLQQGTDTLGQSLTELVFPTDPDEYTPPASATDRIESIEAADHRRPFVVNVRAVAVGTETTAIDLLTLAFGEVGNGWYELVPHRPDDPTTTLDRMTTRTLRTDPSPSTRIHNLLPTTPITTPAIHADPATLGNFTLVGGTDLPPAANRAIDTTPRDRTAIDLPPADTLHRYLDRPGMALGHPIDTDRSTLDDPVSLPSDLQTLHTAIFGASGAGKSKVNLNCQLTNYAATDGADVILAPKGDGYPTEYLRAHYTKFGSLENVYYFDCASTLPAISVFDIEPQLEAGIDREQAVENIADHYAELLAGFMGRERYERAVRSPDIIHYLVKALFDPVHGDDAYSHADLEREVARMHETRDAPPVSQPGLQTKLVGVAANSERSFDELMQGVTNRIEKATRDRRLARLFDHAPPDDRNKSQAAHFDFRDHLDEDCVILLDTSGYREESRRLLTILFLSKLWTALQRRVASADTDDLPLVNLYVEEAADVAASGVLADLLSEGRGFGLGVTLSMQFPRQVKSAHPRVYEELLNDVATVITGPVGVDRSLAERFATADMSPEAVANRLRALDRGEWLVRLPGPFGESGPRPFLCESLPLPEGHPERADTSVDEDVVEAAIARTAATTRSARGLAVDDDAVVEPERRDPDPAAENSPSSVPVDSTLPFTRRLPDCIVYESGPHALVCTTCETRYAPRLGGMRRAIQCCHSLNEVDRDDVPICSVDLTLSATERDRSDYSDRQLVFLQAVYMAHRQRFDRDLEYDVVWDSMIRLQEYVGVDDEAVQELLDDGLLTQDCDYPHRLYTVTAEGREELQVGHREGIAYGHERGDLGESTLHVMMVEVGKRYVEREFVEDTDSSVVRAKSYYEVGDFRFDAVGLDDDDEIVIALEAERSNHDTLEAVPADFDKMAEQNPKEALWIVKNREVAHEVLQALNDPAEGDPRVEKTYSEGVPPRKFSIETAGLTDVVTLQLLRDSVADAG